MAPADVLRIRPEDLHARMARGEKVVVLDVRTEDAVRVYPYQIPGAWWMPLATVVQQADTLPLQGAMVIY